MRVKKTVLLLAACSLLAFAYIVQRGDTLWDLSEEYLRDPFAWPDLWSANTHIQDPHWIYPGDSLCIPGDAPCPENASEISENDTKALKGNIEKYSFKESSSEYRKQEKPKIFNTYYQKLMPILESVNSGNRNSNLFRVLNDEANRPIYHSLEHEMLLGYGKRNFPKLKAGDIAEIWSSRKVSIPNSSGTSDEYFVHRLAALAKVTGVGDSLSRALIVQSFGTLSLESARCRPQRTVETISVSSFEPIKKAKAEEMAEVILVLDKSMVAGLYSYTLISEGKRHNYVPGSAVAFWDFDKRDPTLPPKLLGRGLIVYSDDMRSTVLIRDIYNASQRIDIGTNVSLTHKPVK